MYVCMYVCIYVCLSVCMLACMQVCITVNNECMFVCNVINEWVRLTNWSPNFISYWQSNSSMMPARLKEFLKNEMGIII